MATVKDSVGRHIQGPVRVAVISTSRADYGRIRPLLQELQKREEVGDVELQTILGTPAYTDHLLWYIRHGSPISLLASLPWYLRARLRIMWGGNRALSRVDQLASLFKRDHIKITARIPLHMEGSSHRSMLMTAGLGLLGAAEVFENLAPHAMVLYGDRAELLTIAAAATMLHIPIVHIEGGDVSGTVDEHIRHAITKLSNLHFPITEKSRQRLLRMGEMPEHVFTSGMLALDTITNIDLRLDNHFYETFPAGVGRIDLTKPFLFVMYHPVTTRIKEAHRDADELVSALEKLALPTFIIAPNSDAGGQIIHNALRTYALAHPYQTAFYKAVPVEDFYKLLNASSVCIGNSSSFVRESAFLGVPAVLVGDRQRNRERGNNAIEVVCDAEVIFDAVRKQYVHGKYAPDYRFGAGNSAKKIVDAIVDAGLAQFDFQKVFNDDKI